MNLNVQKIVFTDVGPYLFRVAEPMKRNPTFTPQPLSLADQTCKVRELRVEKIDVEINSVPTRCYMAWDTKAGTLYVSDRWKRQVQTVWIGATDERTQELAYNLLKRRVQEYADAAIAEVKQAQAKLEQRS